MENFRCIVLKAITQADGELRRTVLGSPAGELARGVLVRATSVGVASLGEVGPGGRDHGLRVPIVLGEGVVVSLGVQSVESVLDLRLVEGILSCGSVAPVVGPDGRRGVGGLHPLTGIGPLGDETLVASLRIPDLVGKGGGVASGVQREVLVAGLVTVLVPNDNGQLVSGEVGAGPDVEVQAVLAGARGVLARASGTKRIGNEGFVPWLAGLGSLPRFS